MPICEHPACMRPRFPITYGRAGTSLTAVGLPGDIQAPVKRPCPVLCGTGIPEPSSVRDILWRVEARDTSQLDLASVLRSVAIAGGCYVKRPPTFHLAKIAERDYTRASHRLRGPARPHSAAALSRVAVCASGATLTGAFLSNAQYTSGYSGAHGQHRMCQRLDAAGLFAVIDASVSRTGLPQAVQGLVMAHPWRDFPAGGKIRLALAGSAATACRGGRSVLGAPDKPLESLGRVLRLELPNTRPAWKHAQFSI